MKKFLFKTALFFLPILAYSVLFLVVEVVIRANRIPLELPKDKTILFVGDSHIERGVNEKFIPGAFNWAKPGDNFLNLFARIRELLKANSQIHTVFIGTTPHSFNKNSDGRIFSGYAEKLLQLNIFFYGVEELVDCRDTVLSMLKDYSRTHKRALESIRSQNFCTLKELGGFQDLGDSSEEFWKEIEDGCKLGKKRLSTECSDKCGNELSLKYLRKIVELVRARGGKIIFLNPPIYHEGEFFDVPYFENLLKENFPDVEFWDYANFPMPDDGFYDVNHLNARGAEIFSKELARRINKEGIIVPSGILDQ